MKLWKMASIAAALSGLGLAGVVAEPPAWPRDGEEAAAQPVRNRPGADRARQSADEEGEAKEEEKSELQKMREELERLQIEYQLAQQRQQNDLQKTELEKRAIQAQAELRRAKQEEQMAGLRTQLEQLQAQSQLAQVERQGQLAEAREEIEQGNIQRQLRDLEIATELAELEAQVRRVQQENMLQMGEVQAAQAESQIASFAAMAAVTELRSKLDVADARERLDDRILDEVEHREDPFRDGTLYVSDRRIALNGPIWYGTADYVTERIHFFNNQSKDLPIFIVIDDSPGGSVMEGYRIVKAIESSQAPIHVIVKSFAASMAAVITTLAPHSYAYPNAIILHHQMSSGMNGNLTQQEEQLENSKEWARRLSDPVSRKMGVSPRRFVELMYENNSSGDWEEFGDKAVRLKWVGRIVHEIREEGVRRNPGNAGGAPLFFFPLFKDAEKVDERGVPYMLAPRLKPFDHYFVYNPDGYFRMPPVAGR